ncbi:LysR family transcriptional regulator [Marmoricola endophyticus]|uniref:LysR family transcriptional regulator n=1 Tax=Marmoricola endophyticus TaxID=2040280 RepID=A0A917BD78_9ACTN|nr:LysR family transcriptional regulator [Marmoricola endophyticus]GGF34166.1 LysR family transcriptional regulator [Marmoricola endophyticus]
MDTFRVGFVPGVEPDRFVRRWRERERRPLELVLLEEHAVRDALDDDQVHMVLARLPVDADGLHLIPLWEELPVAVLGTDHVLTLLDDLGEDDLADEIRNDGPAAQAIETAAAGTGVALVPMSLARLHHRKDAVIRVRRDAAPTRIGLAWRQGLDDPGAETFIGVVRGRRAGSTRGDQERARSTSPSPDKPRRPAKQPDRKRSAARSRPGRRR